MLESPHEDFYLMVFILKSWKKGNGDEHLHHPVCEVCQKEFTDTHELSVHIDQTHRKKDISSIIKLPSLTYRIRKQRNRENVIAEEKLNVCPVLMRTNEQKSFLYGDMIFVLF